MKNSEFPVGTVIELKPTETRYEKTADGSWHAVTGHCDDCMASDFISEIHIDEAEARIVSVPFGVAWHLAIMLGDEYGSTNSEGEPITFMGIIQDAVSEYEESISRTPKSTTNPVEAENGRE